ncbi:acyl-CoA dehydrogenase family protein [Pseudobacteriovorax antillogorgiicola]|uniref:Acyl-CoA dehydrogenase n=1 Tax=Pseudobacteriovorax antillogorgiicola TaxID=1513793 RepID=A0A1Y6CRX2_9BACT|nr:acyl-CoA dehydrogenase family protein [Pseudobacteriovorax antillogorgiicola]TCS45850.1 alkylation response protein AidB-like acyl-CoA dehydrogenase [Pseudobacteriovorax antillogorgiicola]SMF71752.1 Acyl-CoA dehydrogenase [Pseudobacteriovorax antillogorgiicola]
MKAKGNFFLDNDDMRYQILQEDKLHELYKLFSSDEKEALGVSTTEEFQSLWLEMIESVGEFAGTQLRDNAAQVEKEDLVLKDGKVEVPPTMQSNVKTFVELGAHALSVPIKHGGMDAPILMELAGSEMIARACPSTLLNVGWYSSIANIIALFGNEEIQSMFLPDMITGEVSGSMSLTEPDVGSDLASMRSYGEEQEDGTWKIYGSKQFISNGSGGLSLVLAQNKKGAKGLKSLSLFVVPQELDGKANYIVSKIEEKPGLHGSATCALQFDGSKGWLVGKNGLGFKYMSLLMNEARLAVGFQGLGLMEACYRLAKDYADQRVAWSKPISQHEMICEKLLDMEAEIKTFRSLLYRGSYYASIVHFMERRIEDKALGDERTKELEKEIKNYQRKLREWTPLLKWWSGERSFVIARTCLQIHGGYGFTKEYQPEWWVRESLIISIYEGTSEIQALMCIKDTIKDIIRNPRRFAESLVAARMKALAETDAIKKRYYRIKLTYLNSIVTLVMKLMKQNVKGTFNENKSSDIIGLLKKLRETLVTFDNISPALLNASRICEMKAIVALSKAAVEDGERDPSRRSFALRFVNRWYPTMLRNKAELEWDDEQVAAIAQSKDDIAQASEG